MTTTRKGWSRLDELEVGNVTDLWLRHQKLHLSMLEAAIDISQRIHQGRRAGDNPIPRKTDARYPGELFPHCEVVLRELAHDWRLMLITKGDGFEQSLKIERTGSERLFSLYRDRWDENNFDLPHDLRALPAGSPTNHHDRKLYALRHPADPGIGRQGGVYPL